MLTGITFITLIAGLLAIAGVSGIGRLLLRRAPELPLHWYVALSMLTGMAACSFAVQLLAMHGASQRGFALAGALTVALGLAGQVASGRRWSAIHWPPRRHAVTALWIILTLAVMMLVPISLAPSTKIDEIQYHMLIGQRIAADHGLRVYQLPFEQAIPLQIGYQIAETPFHAWGVMDGGNVLSLGFGLALLLMLYGTVTEASGRPELGLVAASAGAVGLYPAVWHVTSGAHALGDLATFSAIAALLFPGKLLAAVPDGSGAQWRALVCILTAAIAASTKISLVPLGLMISACACWQLPRANWPRAIMSASAHWGLILGPLIVWSTIHTHSPLGAAFAGLFGPSTYQPEVFQRMAFIRMSGHYDLATIGYETVTRLNGLSIAMIVLGALACWRCQGMHRAFLALVAVQLALIAALLPYDFRFLGGLQYGLLAAGVIALKPRWTRPGAGWVAIALLAPWLLAEAVYALPMLRVSLGLTTRAAFIDRYVAFAADFRALDRILPANAVLIAPAGVPSVYAPRPLIFHRADWDGRSPLFAFRFGDESPAGCGAEIYRNPAAVVQTWRTPGMPSERAALVVERCTR